MVHREDLQLSPGPAEQQGDRIGPVDLEELLHSEALGQMGHPDLPLCRQQALEDREVHLLAEQMPAV